MTTEVFIRTMGRSCSGSNAIFVYEINKLRLRTLPSGGPPNAEDNTFSSKTWKGTKD